MFISLAQLMSLDKKQLKPGYRGTKKWAVDQKQANIKSIKKTLTFVTK